MRTITKILAIFLIGALFSFAFLNNDLSEKIVNKLEVYRTYQLQEKLYLHFDKTFYAPGENIWFNTYLVDGHMHKPRLVNTLAYVELIAPNGKILFTHNIRIENGSGKGDFKLNKELVPGRYMVRAYTNFMRNFDQDYFFQKHIDLIGTAKPMSNNGDTLNTINELASNATDSIAKPKVQVQFFPEGGDLVNNLTSIVAIKINDSYGRNLKLEGMIVDQNDNIVSFFQSTKFGTGIFNLTPKPGQVYYAKLKNHNSSDKLFPLPSALSQGYVIRVNTTKNGFIEVVAKTNRNDGLGGSLLLGQMRGIPIYSATGPDGQREVKYKFPKQDLQDGILQFTLFDQNGEPHCERLIFVENESNKIETSITSNKQEYGNREKVEVDINMKDLQGNSIGGNLSLSVVNWEYIPENNNYADIRSYILLTSDIKGQIENPGYFFNEDNKDRKFLLDCLLMTQGWRRFNWKSVLDEYVQTLEYPYEQGFSIGGQITKLGRKDKPIEGFALITTLGETPQAVKINTDEYGRFLLTGCDFVDSTDVIIQGGIEKERKKKKEGKSETKSNHYVSVFLDEFSNPPLDMPSRKSDSLRILAERHNKYLNEHHIIRSINASFNPDGDAVILKGVEIKAAKDKRNDPFYRTEQIYSSPSHRVVIDSLNNYQFNVMEMLRGRLPGVIIRGGPVNYTVTIRGPNSFTSSTQPLFLLNGIVVDVEAVTAIDPSIISHVDVIKGPRAAIFGSRGANGAIAVYTKKGMQNGNLNQSPSYGVVNFKHPGYYKAREFFEPNYSVEKPEHEKPDFRSTLHWEPEIRVDSTGKARVSFFTSDNESTFQIVLEGITDNGNPIRKTSFIDVGSSN